MDVLWCRTLPGRGITGKVRIADPRRIDYRDGHDRPRCELRTTTETTIAVTIDDQPVAPLRACTNNCGIRPPKPCDSSISWAWTFAS